MANAGIRVFVPAHITGFFSVHRTSDPRQTGSRGAGITLADGVTVTVERADDPVLTINGREADLAPIDAVQAAFDCPSAVRAETDVPMGAGFGVSGALTTGSAIGLNYLSERARSENELIELAHVAEVEAGTGLGDVVAQQRGGVPIRLEPGAPGHGRLDGIPERRPIEYLSFGELSTESVLDGDMQSVTAAGEDALESLRATPTLDQLMESSRQFSATTGLETPRIRSVIDAVEEAGGSAAMAMLGRTVFALDRGLSDAGYEPTRCEMGSNGIRVESSQRSDE